MNLLKSVLSLPHGTFTFSLSGVMVAAGGWLLAHPDIVTSLAPQYGAPLLMVLGGLTSVARLRGIIKTKVSG